MAGKRVRFSRQYYSFHIEGVGDAPMMDSDRTFSSLDIIDPASLSSLRRAMFEVYSERHYSDPTLPPHRTHRRVGLPLRRPSIRRSTLTRSPFMAEHAGKQRF